MKPLEEILAKVPPRNEEERKAAEAFYEALNGGLRRDTLDNNGAPFTGDVLEASEKKFDAFVDDPHFQDMILKG